MQWPGLVLAFALDANVLWMTALLRGRSKQKNKAADQPTHKDPTVHRIATPPTLPNQHLTRRQLTANLFQLATMMEGMDDEGAGSRAFEQNTATCKSSWLGHDPKHLCETPVTLGGVTAVFPIDSSLIDALTLFCFILFVMFPNASFSQAGGSILAG